MIFPTMDVEILDKVVEESYGKKFFKFNFDTKKFVVKDGKLVEIPELEYIKQYIQWLLNTVPGKFEIYEKDFGVSYVFLGSKSLPLGYINSEIKRQIEKQLAIHPSISELSNFKFSHENGVLIVSFKVLTNLGNTLDISEEVVIK